MYVIQLSRASAVYREWEIAEVLPAFHIVIGNDRKILHTGRRGYTELLRMNSGNYYNDKSNHEPGGKNAALTRYYPCS